MSKKRVLRLGILVFVIGVLSLGAIRAVVVVAKSFPSVERVLTQSLEDRPGHEVRMEVVTFPPGSASPNHRHPGHVFVYVLEGELETRVGDGEVTLYQAGDSFYEPTKALHADTRNPSDTVTARILAVMLTEEGKASVQLAF